VNGKEVLLIVFAIQGWSEAGAWKDTLFVRILEKISGVKVVVPDYLDGKGRFAKFKSHLTVEQYASIVRVAYERMKEEYPDVPVLIMGHSLGGLIARYLCNQGLFPPENMILVGTPNRGFSRAMFGKRANIIVLPILKFLAKYICNVPLLFQLLPGSEFLERLRKADGYPFSAYYIYGKRDKVVPRKSADPYGKGTEVDCGHHLIPQKEGDNINNSALPVIIGIIEQRLGI